MLPLLLAAYSSVFLLSTWIVKSLFACYGKLLFGTRIIELMPDAVVWTSANRSSVTQVENTPTNSQYTENGVLTITISECNCKTLICAAEVVAAAAAAEKHLM